MVEDYITYVCVSSPNLDKLKRHLNCVFAYVDRCVVVIGNRDEEAEKFLKSITNLTLVHRVWDDSFRAQYQAALDQISGGWMLWLDDNEVPSKMLLDNLRNIIETSQGATRFDTVAFRSCDIRDGGEEEPSGYRRELLTAWNPALRFKIDLHQSMGGKRRGVSSDLIYYNYSTEESSVQGSCRNFFISGVWADGEESFAYWQTQTGQDPRLDPQNHVGSNGIAVPLFEGFKIDAWHEMKDILNRKHPQVVVFKDLDNLIKSGDICQEFKDWASQHNEFNDQRSHLSELHSFDKYIKQHIPSGGIHGNS